MSRKRIFSRQIKKFVSFRFHSLLAAMKHISEIERMIFTVNLLLFFSTGGHIFLLFSLIKKEHFSAYGPKCIRKIDLIVRWEIVFHKSNPANPDTLRRYSNWNSIRIQNRIECDIRGNTMCMIIITQSHKPHIHIHIHKCFVNERMN